MEKRKEAFRGGRRCWVHHSLWEASGSLAHPVACRGVHGGQCAHHLLHFPSSSRTSSRLPAPGGQALPTRGCFKGPPRDTTVSFAVFLSPTLAFPDFLGAAPTFHYCLLTFHYFLSTCSTHGLSLLLTPLCYISLLVSSIREYPVPLSVEVI